MSKKSSFFFIFSLLTFLLLTSCSPQQTVTSTPSEIPSLAPTLIAATTSPELGCNAISAEPTPQAALSAFPTVSSADYTRGPATAPVTMIEYCDFQEPICISMAAVASNLVYKHPNDLQFVFRPIASVADKSQLALQAALAADEQGHFWEMYDMLFQKNAEWAALSTDDFQTWVKGQAIDIGLDGAKFNAAFQSPETAARAKAMTDAATSAGLQRGPLVLINGKPQPLFALDYNTLDSNISLIALGARQFKSCPPFSIDASKQYIATIHAEKGDIVIQLFADKAPLAVNSFVFLAQNGWFDGVTFHRVLPGFVAQAGDPSGTGRGGPGYFFNNETNDLKFDKPGMVGMANSGPDTNGSQFFITFAPQSNLNGAYTIFGQVIKGMDVVESLTPRDPDQTPNLPPGDKIINLTIEVK
ncbi:MAG TPA: peptidylprolyl isomerase [Anaerolineales bacterium]|nr:peptidylprolyl isomerase [Anaerolineales bacterium]